MGTTPCHKHQPFIYVRPLAESFSGWAKRSFFSRGSPMAPLRQTMKGIIFLRRNGLKGIWNSFAIWGPIYCAFTTFLPDGFWISQKNTKSNSSSTFHAASALCQVENSTDQSKAKSLYLYFAANHLTIYTIRLVRQKTLLANCVQPGAHDSPPSILQRLASMPMTPFPPRCCARYSLTLVRLIRPA